ncbi:MAG: hypothetical protein HOB26_11430 [Flavobacteriales bacterium]|jgi:uroporphyrinogen decarboxylase|nr:hypothetical protein [Flavobacteriales bacterium]
MKIDNHILLRAARGERVERTPVWLLRQAGRILSDYRAIRYSISRFKELGETPDLVCEVNLQPVDILDIMLQGNLESYLPYSDKVTIKEATKKMLNTFGCTRHIANLGHGLYPDTNPD